MVVFEDELPSALRMKNSFVYALWFWAKTYPEFQSLVVIHFCFLWSLFRGW